MKDVSILDDKKLNFRISRKGKEISISCKSKEEKNEWMTTLQRSDEEGKRKKSVFEMF